MSVLLWNHWNCILFIIASAIVTFTYGFNAKHMPAVFWDPRNPLFNCPSRGVNTILVKMGDYISFVCPVGVSNLGMQSSKLNYIDLYENAYFVYPEKKKDALTCNVTGYRPFLKCERKSLMFGQTIRIAPASGDSFTPLFDYGKTYYVIGTGNGLKTGIDNQVGGQCNTVTDDPEQTYKFILKIRVCSKEEETVYKNCTICKTIGCYNRGCGLYGEWSQWQYNQNVTNLASEGVLRAPADVDKQQNLTTCSRKRYRRCDNDVTGCDGPGEQTEIVPCPARNCTPWIENGKYFEHDAKTNSYQCYTRRQRNCTAREKKIVTITESKMEEKIVCKKDCTPWIENGEYFQNDATTNSYQCFIRKQRNCTMIGGNMVTTTESKMEESTICKQGVKKAGFRMSTNSGNISLSMQYLVIGVIGLLIIGFALGFLLNWCLRFRKTKYRHHTGSLLQEKRTYRC